MAWINISILDAWRVSVMVKCIPSVVIWYDRGSIVGSIGIRRGES
jgi:hypothetical protein